ncbi:hypothetical protein [Acrocarpospora macrocephala]
MISKKDSANASSPPATDRIIGNVASRNVVNVSAPRSADASSMDTPSRRSRATTLLSTRVSDQQADGARSRRLGEYRRPWVVAGRADLDCIGVQGRRAGRAVWFEVEDPILPVKEAKDERR